MARCPQRRAVALVDLLAVIAMLGTLMGLFVGALQKVRTSSTRLACQNNMRQLGQALLQFNDQRRYFPPSQDQSGADSVTWLKMILPYVGYENAKAEDPIPLYVCPADRDSRSLIFVGTSTSSASKAFATPSTAPCTPGSSLQTASTTQTVKYACSSYAAVVSSKNVNGPYDAVMYPKSRTRPVDITDGLSNTAIVGERPPSADLVWGWWASPFRGDITMGSANMYRLPILYSVRAGAPATTQCPAIPYFGPGSLDNPCDTQHFWSFHPFGANWLLADGSVHFIQYRAALQIPLLSTRAGSDVIDWQEVF